jgi:glycosyltransferase involved in cell wall biosynthesis
MTTRMFVDAKRAFHNHAGLGEFLRNSLRALREDDSSLQLELYSPQVRDSRGKEYVQDFSKPGTHIHLGPSGARGSLWRTALAHYLPHSLIMREHHVFWGPSHELPFQGLKALKMKKLLTVHDIFFHRFPQDFPFIDRLGYRLKLLHALKHADIIHVICEQTKKDLISFFNVDPKRIHVVYQCLGDHYFKMLPGEECSRIIQSYGLGLRPYFLYVSSFLGRKNHRTLLEAYRDHASLSEESDLVLVGRENALSRQLRKEFPLKNIHFIHDAQTQDLLALYQQSYAQVYVSLFEGFGLPIAESLASFKPALCFYESCFPETAQKAGHYVDVRSPHEIALGMEKLLTNREYYQELCRQAELERMRFQGPAFAKEFKKLL